MGVRHPTALLIKGQLGKTIIFLHHFIISRFLPFTRSYHSSGKHDKKRHLLFRSSFDVPWQVDYFLSAAFQVRQPVNKKVSALLFLWQWSIGLAKVSGTFREQKNTTCRLVVPNFNEPVSQLPVFASSFLHTVQVRNKNSTIFELFLSSVVSRISRSHFSELYMVNFQHF